MYSRRSRAFDYALRAIRRESSRTPAVSGRGASRLEQSMARRELDSYRRGQGLPYWHHDRY
jgi:hypothetical protein